MGWLEALKNLLAAIPILDRWFTKTPSEKIAKKQRENGDRFEHQQKTGRPKWD